jgi:hypothetical protein
MCTKTNSTSDAVDVSMQQQQQLLLLLLPPL